MAKKTTDALEILDAMIGDDVELRDLCEEATINAEVAQLIYNARTEAGLSQQQLADKIGTTQSVISRLEDADYEGHSLSMMNRIAHALNQEISIQFVPAHDRDRFVPPQVSEGSFQSPSL